MDVNAKNNPMEHEHSLPPDLRAVEAGLDRLGAQERASAPADLESRLLVASRFHLNAEAREAQAMPRHTPGVVMRIARMRTVRMAAAVALLVTGVAVGVRVMTGGGGATGPLSGGADELIAGTPLDAEAADLLALSSDGADSPWSLGGDALSLLESELLALESGVRDPWSWFDELEAEDSL